MRTHGCDEGINGTITAISADKVKAACAVDSANVQCYRARSWECSSLCVYACFHSAGAVHVLHASKQQSDAAGSLLLLVHGACLRYCGTAVTSTTACREILHAAPRRLW